MVNKKLKNIIFDFDGVIVDTYDIVFNIFREKYTDVTHKKFQDLFDTGIDDDDAMGIADGEEFIKWFFERYKTDLKSGHILPDIAEYLGELNRQYNLFLITSNSERVTSDFLKQNKLNYFNRISGYETDRSKVVKFKILEKDFEVNSKNSIFITDTLADIVEGQQAGYKVLAETFGYHNRERLEKGNPDWIVNSWDEIIKTIAQINN
jgi:phosphoglycolate phosphatase-like HAD superfamily hydrolase